MNGNAEFEAKLEALDLSLFEKIPSETLPVEKRSLLAIQRAVRRLRPNYVYLEIGSHLGGSIQPHLLDTACRKIYSIDKRPARQPDAWRKVCYYPENSTERMLALLRTVAPDQMGKIECFDSDTSALEPSKISEPPDLCFIDAEHTPESVLRDFRFCLSVSHPDAVIVFHDCQIVFEGMRRIFDFLLGQGIPYHGIKLDGSVYAIALGVSHFPRDPLIRRLAARAWLPFMLFVWWGRIKRRLPPWARRALLPVRRVAAWVLYKKPMSDRRE